MTDVDDLKAAQFMLGSDYPDFIWKLREKENPSVTRPSMAWPFKRSDNVVQLPRKKNK